MDKREGSLKQRELERNPLKRTEGRSLPAINGEEMRVQKGGKPALAPIPGAETRSFGLSTAPSSTLDDDQGPHRHTLLDPRHPLQISRLE